jgi:hypothetical protein
MTLPATFHATVEALRDASATEEMIAAAIKAGGNLRIPHHAREAGHASMRMARRVHASLAPT